MSELNFQDLSTVQSAGQPKPKTVAAAATIAPSGFLTFVTGTTGIATITPPVTGQHLLALVFATNNSGVFLTTGNINVTTTTVVMDVPVLLIYDPIEAKYYPMLGK